MKIRVLVPLWKRPEVTRFCFEGLKKLQAESKHEIDVSCVMSDGEFVDLCDEFGFDWVDVPNEPLGNKINEGIRFTIKHSYDYLMIMNSDDVVKAELIDKYYQPFFDSLKPYFGVDTVTYVNWKTREARRVYYEFTVLGIAKMIRRDAVESMRGNLYRADLNKCLDHTMMDIMIANKYYPEIVKYDGELAMDYKSEVNIHPWEKFQNMGKNVTVTD